MENLAVFVQKWDILAKKCDFSKKRLLYLVGGELAYGAEIWQLCSCRHVLKSEVGIF